jgi:hypothetical protein
MQVHIVAKVGISHGFDFYSEFSSSIGAVAIDAANAFLCENQGSLHQLPDIKHVNNLQDYGEYPFALTTEATVSSAGIQRPQSLSARLLWRW